VLQYPDGKDLCFSNGKILSTSDNLLLHSCSTHKGSSGSPIISRKSNYSVIGLHTGSYKNNKLNDKFSFNLSTPIISIINDIKDKFKNKKIIMNDINKINEVNEYNKSNNYIIAELNAEKNSKIKIISSFEEFKNNFILKNYNPIDYNNEKDIKKNCEISVNNKKIDFCYFYEFKEKGKYTIKYSFKKNLTNTNSMFCDCSSLSKLDLSNFNARNVTNMSSMFFQCSSLTNIDLSNFNTQNATNMRDMFFNCSLLSKLDLSNFNTQNVTNMSGMFLKCSLLTKLDLSSFNTQNVTDMAYMFYGCSSLTYINLSSFNTQNVTNMCNMFSRCSSLSNIDLSSFNTQNVTNMSCMFKECSSLSILDLSNFNILNMYDMSDMFIDCKSLKKEDLITQDIKILNEYDKICIIF